MSGRECQPAIQAHCEVFSESYTLGILSWTNEIIANIGLDEL